MGAAAAALLLAAGCLPTEPGGAEGARLDARSLSAEVRPYLGSDRLLRYPDPVVESGALDLPGAVGFFPHYLDFVRTAVGNLRDYLEELHRAPIDWAHVLPCGRVFLARSLFDPLPRDPILGTFRKAYGDMWQLDACDRPGEVVFRTELATTTGVRFEAGRIQFDCIGTVCTGEDFLSYGLESPGLRPDYSPEAAVAAVYQVTGVPIARLPAAQGFAGNDAPFLSTIGMRWEVTTVHPVELARSTTGARDTSSVFYYAPRCRPEPRACLRIAAHNQPGPFEFITEELDPITGATRGVTVRLVPRLPILLEEFVVPEARPRLP